MAFGLKKLTSLFNTGITRKRGKQIIGVDIGSSSIKVVQLRNDDGTPTLETYGELQLGPYASASIGQTADLSQKTLVEALVDIVREASVNGNTAVLSIPYASSFATALTVDAIEEDDIAARVPVEARKYIPVSLAEVTLDWFPLAKNENTSRTELFLVAIHNETLERLRDVLAGAGLATMYTELEPFSTIRSTLSVKEPTAAILDLGASSTKLYIVREGIIQATHALAHGGSELTDDIARAENVPFSTAEEYKRSIGLTETAEHALVARTIRGSLDRLAREADKVIDEYEHTKGTDIASIVMVGGGATMPGLAALLSDMLQRQVTLADPFSKVAYPAFLSDTLKTAGPSFAVALGGALRTFE